MLKTGRPTRTAKDKSMEAVKEIEPPFVQIKRFNADIPAELHTALKIQAAKEGIKLNELASKAFNEYLSK